MAADLWLHDLKPGDLTLRRDRSGADLWLQQRTSADLRLQRPPDRHADLHAVIPPPISQITANAQSQSQADLHALLPQLASQMEAAYDNAVWRGVESGSVGVYQPGGGILLNTASLLQNTAPIKPGIRLVWQPGRRRQRPMDVIFGAMRRRPAPVCSPHQPGRRTGTQRQATFEAMGRLRRPESCTPWQAANHAQHARCMPWQDMGRKARPRSCTPFQTAALRIRRWCSDWQIGRRACLDYCNDWKTGAVRYGWGGPIVIYVPPPPPEVCALVGQADLILRQDRDSVLVLRKCRRLEGKAGPTIYIPVARVYLVSNDAHLTRVSDGLELPVFAMSMGIDADAWGWRFDAELPADQLANVQPGTEPVEVEAVVNTYIWRFLIEDIRRERSFGKSRIRIGGRSLAARLADPYSPQVNRKNTIDLNATQILDDLLTDNGVPIGWTIDWQLTDWLVTAGAWAHAGTYLDGVKKVAEAAGAIVQADRSAQTLRILHRYPIAPWDWPTAAPAYTIPEAIVATEGVEWIEKPPYNATYVSGETLGILGHVVRSGTAGDFAAPMVTHPLITAREAARQRGLAILADTGKQAIYTLSMPIDPAGTGLGLLDVCQLIEYGPATIRGLVRSVNVSVKSASVRQTITMETHL